MNTEKNDSTLPAVPEQSSADSGAAQQVTVITPEVVDDSRQGYKQQTFSGTSADGSRFTYATWSSGGLGGLGGMGAGGMVARDGCLPGLVTIALAAVCAVQFGILSAIGFLVFYALGSGMGFFWRVRCLMQGKNVSPWFFRVGAWLVSSLLVVWLSDGF